MVNDIIGTPNDVHIIDEKNHIPDHVEKTKPQTVDGNKNVKQIKNDHINDTKVNKSVEEKNTFEFTNT